MCVCVKEVNFHIPRSTLTMTATDEISMPSARSGMAAAMRRPTPLLNMAIMLIARRYKKKAPA